MPNQAVRGMPSHTGGKPIQFDSKHLPQTDERGKERKREGERKRREGKVAIIGLQRPSRGPHPRLEQLKRERRERERSGGMERWQRGR